MKNFYINKLLLIVGLILTVSSVFSQTSGDYRTKGAGSLNWSVVSNWEVFDGTNWGNASEYPGQSSGSGQVTVKANSILILDTVPANTIGSLVVEGLGELQLGNDTTQRIIEIQDSLRIEANGKLEPASDARAHIIKLHGDLINNGTLNLRKSFTKVADVEFYETGTIKGDSVPTFNSIIFKDGCNITADVGLDVNKNFYLESNSTFNDGGFTHTVEYEWYNYGGTFNATGKVVFNGGTGAIAETGTNTIFNKLIFNGGGLNVIKQRIAVNDTFNILNNTKVAPGNVGVYANGDFIVEEGSDYTQVQNTTYFNGSNAQVIQLDGEVSFYNISFSNGGDLERKTINGNLLVNGTLTDNTSATIQGPGDHVIYRGIRLNGGCEFSGNVTLKGGYIDTNNNDVDSISVGVGRLIIDGSTYVRHAGAADSTVILKMNNNLVIQNGYLIINSDATVKGNSSDTLFVYSGKYLYVRGSDNFPTNFSVYDIDPLSYVRYDADIPQTIRGGDDVVYGHLYLNNNVKTVDDSLTITGNLYLYGSTSVLTLNLGTYSHLFSGSNIYNSNGSSIDGSLSTFVIGDRSGLQYIRANTTGLYTFKNLVIRETSATQTSTKYFYNGCNLKVTNDFKVENIGGTSAIQLIVDLNENGINDDGTVANDFSLGEYSKLYTDNTDVGVNFFDKFSGTKVFDVTSTVYYSLDDAQNIAGGITYGNILFYSGNKTATGSLDINGDVGRTGAVVFYDGGFVHTVAGNWYLNNTAYYTQASATGTIVFDGNNQTIDGYNFNNLIVNSTGDVGLARNLTIFGDLTVGDGSTLNVATLGLYVGGDIEVNGAGILSQSTGTTTMNGTGKQLVSLNANSSLGRFYINKPTVDDTVKVLEELHVNGDTYIYGSAGVLDIRSQNVYFGGRLYRRENPGVSNFLTDTSNVYFDGATAQYVYNYHDEDIIFNNLIFEGSGDKMLLHTNPSDGIASLNLIVKGDFTINNCVVDGYNQEIYVYGDWNNSGTFNHGRTVYFIGEDQDVSSSSFYHVKFEGSGTKTLGGGITVSYDLTIDSVATLDADNNNITLGRNWDNSDSRASFISGTGKVIFNSTSGSHIYTGTISGDVSGKTFYDFEINKSASSYLDGDLVVKNNFEIGSGTFYTYAYDVWVSGDFDVNGTFSANSSADTLTLNASGGTKIFNPNGATLQKVIFDAGSTYYNQQSDFTIDNNNMDIISGTLDMNGNRIRLYDSGRKINISGGTLRIDTSAVIEFTNSQSIEMTSGELYMVGLSDSLAVLENSSTNTSTLFTVNVTGGTVYAQNYKVQQGQIVLSGAAAIDATHNFSGGVYTNGAGTGAYLTLTGLDFSDFTVNNATFNTGPAYNVSRTSGTGKVTFYDAAGGLAGEANDEDDGDPGSLIDWTFPAGYYWDGGGSTSKWSEAANWTGDVVPGADDIVYLDNTYASGGYTVDFDLQRDSCSRMKIDGGGSNNITLNIGSNDTLVIGGDIIIGTGTSLAQADNTAMLYISGNWTNLGTYTHNNSTIEFAAQAGSYILSTGGAGVGKNFYNLNINAGESKYMLDAAMEVENDINVTSGTLDLASPSNDVTVKGDWVVDQASGGSFVASSADVTLDGTDKQQLTNGVFYNLIINNISDTIVLNSNIAVDYSLTLQSGTVLNGKDYNIYVRRNWINNGGEFTQTGFGTVVFDGVSTQYIENGTDSTTFNNITFSNGGTKYLRRGVKAEGDVMIYSNSGTVNLGTHELIGEGSDNTFICNRYLLIGGENNFPSDFETVTLADNSQVFYYSDSLQYIYPTTYGHIYLRSVTDSISTPAKKIATDDIVVKGYLNLDGYHGRWAVLDMETNDKNIFLYGSYLRMSPGCKIKWGTGKSTLIHNGVNFYLDQDIDTLNNVILTGTGDKYLQGDGTAEPLVITGNLEIKSGIDLMMYYSSNRGYYRRIIGSGTDTIKVETGARIFNTTPDTAGVAIPENFSVYDINENSTYYFYSTSNQIIYTGSGISYGNVTFYNDKTVTSDGVADLDINGIWNIYQSTYDDNGKDIYCSGSEVYLTNYTPSSVDRKFVLDGLRDQRILDNQNNSISLAQIVFSGTQTKTIGDGNDVVTIDGDWLVEDGVIVTTSRIITFNGQYWTNNGIYKQTGNKLVFSGAVDQVIDPGTPDDENYFRDLEFSNRSKKTFINNGFNVNGNITIVEDTVDLGSLTHYLYDELYNTDGGVLVSKDASLILDGGYQYLYTPDFEIDNLSCGGTGQKRMQSDWTINGSLVIDSASYLNTYNGDSDDPNYFDIYIKRNWTNNGTFNDNNQKVVFNSDISIVDIASGGSNFYDVEFSPAVVTEFRLQSTSTRISNVMTVGVNATLNLNGKELFLNRNYAEDRRHVVNGTLKVNAGAKLIVNNYPTQDTIDVYGTFELLGSGSDNVATLTSETTDNRNRTFVNLKEGAKMSARYYLVEYIADQGLALDSGSVLDPVNNMSDGTWLNLRDVQDARYIDFRASCTSDTIKNVSFGFNGVPTVGKHFNVRRENVNDTIVFYNVTGALGTFRYEDDDEATASYNSGLLRWPEVTETYWTGNVDVDWHKEGNWDNGVPTPSTDAVIEDKNNDPIIFSSDAECKDLKIVDGTLRIESGNDLYVNADLSVSTGLLYVNSDTSDIIISGDWITDTQGHFSHGGATVIFNSGEGAATIVPGYENFNNITFDNANTTFTISGATLYLDGDLTVNAGVVSPVTNYYKFYVKGDYSIVNGTFDTDAARYGGTIFLNGDADQTVTNGVCYHISVDGSGIKKFAGVNTIYGTTYINSTLKAETGSAIEFKGDVHINSSGVFDDGGENHTFNGVNWYGDGTYTGSGTVTFNRTSSNQNLYDASFNNLVVDCSTRSLYLKGNVAVAGNLTLKNGVASVYLSDDNLFAGGNTFMVEDDVNLYVYGANNFPKGFTSYNLLTASNTRYYGASDQNVDGVSYGKLYLNNENTKTLTGDMEVKGRLTFYNSTLDVSANNYTITLGGDYWLNTTAGGNFVCRQGEVIFNGSIRQYVSYSSDNQNDFYDLTINSTGDYVYAYNNTSNDFIVKNNLTVNSSIFHANGRVIYVGGDLLASDSGTGGFYNSGTYYLNKTSGNAKIGFNGSTVHSVTINSGATYTAQNNLALAGDFNLIAGTFNGNGMNVSLGNDGTDVVSVDGTYIVGAGGVLGIGSGTSMKISNSGRLEVVGGAGGVATVSNNVSGGRYNLTIEGEIAADNYLFEYMTENGIYLTETSTIDNTYHFSNGTFSNGYSRGQLFRVENTQNFIGSNRLENVSFPNNPGGSAFNVAKYSASSGTLEFYDCSGVFAGESYDNDPNDLINWTGPVKLTWNGSVNTDWNNVDNWSASSGNPIVPRDTTDVIIPGSLVNYPNLTTKGQVSANLTIESGGQMKINTPNDNEDIDMDINGAFIINGQLLINSVNDFVNVDADWTQSSSAVVSNDGTITFDGTSGTALINSQGSGFNNLVFDGATQYQLATATTVSGDFKITADSYFGVGTNYQLTLKGNFENAGTFNSESGKVVFASETGDKSITCGVSSFYDMNIDAAGVTYSLLDNITVSRDLKIVDGILDVNGNTMSVGRSLSISGSLVANTASILDMDDGASVAVNDGGLIELIGTDVDRAAITCSSGGRFSFDVNSGGSIKAQYYTVDYVDADGLYMAPGSNIDVTYNLSDGIFSNGYPSSGTYMTLLHEMSENDTIRNLVFNSGPKYNVTRTSGTTIFFFEDASGDLGNYLYEKDDEINASASSGLLQWPYEKLYTWEGDVSSSWGEAENWFNSELPDAGNSVTIKDNGGVNPVITVSDGEVIINGVTIESGTLTVQPGAKFTITGDLSTTGDTAVLIIDNTVDNPASVNFSGAVTDTVNVNWTYPAGQYWYIGHSVQGMKYSDFNTPTGGSFNLYKYTGSAWSQITDANYDFDANPVEGYAFKNSTADDVTISFSGKLHNQGYSYTINGWNLIANPYSSYIDVEDAGFDYDNSLTTVWTTTNRQGATQYATYDIDSDLGQLGGTRYIAPGQSIWLRNYSAGTFNIAISTGVHAPLDLTQEESQLKGAMVSETDDVLRFTFDDGKAYDEVVVAFRSYGTLGEMTKYDSEKRLGSETIPNAFALKGGVKAAISVYPEEMNNDTVYLGYIYNTEEEITIKATNIDNFAALSNVFLFDKLAGVEVNLRETPEYTFMSTAGEDDDRFEIYFTHVTTNIDNNIDGIAGEQIQIYGTGQKGIVKITEDILAEAQGKGIVRLYSASGSMIKEFNLTDVKTTIDLPVNYGVYIIEVSTGERVVTGKVTRMK